MTAYYNEFDPKAAKWLEMLILEGDIAPGHVDTRSIEDVRPGDLAGYTQCHFFAGIGGWSLALRMAGWPDDRAVWTGSCPCQPFSQAGKGGGFDDERHLWPAWHWLIQQRRPPVIFGEQVASPAGINWFGLVRADLEGTDYCAVPVDIPAAGVGAPHIRQRLYWMAHHHLGCEQHSQRDSQPGAGSEEGARRGDAGRRGKLCQLADDGIEGRRQIGKDAGRCGEGSSSEGLEQRSMHGGVIELANSSSKGLEVRGEQQARGQREAAERSGTAWDTCEWIHCRDGKSRPVEPGTFPLAHGVPGRVGLLRGYGNAIVPQVAAAFIEAYMTC